MNIHRTIGLALSVAAIPAACTTSHGARTEAQNRSATVRHGPAQSAKDAPALQIPDSVRREHEQIHAALTEATRAADPVGQAARDLAHVLHPHFVREEQIALPPLGLLQELAGGTFRPSMRRVLPMTDALRAELPRMLREHIQIGAAARRLEEVARRAGNREVEQLARTLQAHARSEEQIFYPAAILVGEVVQARSAHSSRPVPAP
jgi:hypothetical protein